jgi:hypothetical protein
MEQPLEEVIVDDGDTLKEVVVITRKLSKPFYE